ncbi:hypothetical protein ACOSQ2_003033 [Xanthoceras sorbifolium]
METDHLSNLPEPIIHHILSLLDIKSAFRTSLLSKEWRFHWTHIDHLNFEFDTNFEGCHDFIANVFRHPLNINSVRVHLRCYQGPALEKELLEKISSHALSHGAKELETNVITRFPPTSLGNECQNQLKTLKLGPCTIHSFDRFSSTPYLNSTYYLNSFDRFTSLTSLQLHKVVLSKVGLYDPEKEFDFSFFSSFPNLENLSLIQCHVPKCKLIFNISAPRLVSLTMSDFSIYETVRIAVPAATLKFFNLNGKQQHPLPLSMKNCQSLEKANIDLFAPATTGFLKKAYIFNLTRTMKTLPYTNSLTVSCTFSSKGKILLYRNSQVAGIKFVDLEESEDQEWLPVALCMVRGLGLNQLAAKLEEKSKQMVRLAPVEIQLV